MLDFVNQIKGDKNEKNIIKIIGTCSLIICIFLLQFQSIFAVEEAGYNSVILAKENAKYDEKIKQFGEIRQIKEGEMKLL